MSPEFEDVRALVLSMVDHCSHCGQPFAAEHLTLIGRTPFMWAFRLSCPNCGAQSLVAAMVGEQDAAAELNRRRRALYRPEHHAEPVTEDDVRAIREFLEHFDGDFQRLFGYR
ncbi:hypothetical protein [Thermorudis peleae]|jgi:predicted  nucleic acid-binding Zn-ribbon protein|uniref:hypothetical protein n=1 Tax=Thermorudis peleae TaxID=1382356 RepID=UPI00056E660F|nr:hypothetical protein [Thermorudis peleae]MBX6753413.1 hypothetical protein [Thermorudis peleae]